MRTHDNAHASTNADPEPVRQDRFLRVPDVIARVGFCRSSLYNLIARGKFPAPYDLSSDPGEPRPRRTMVGWLESEVNAWIASRTAAGRSAARAGIEQARQVA